MVILLIPNSWTMRWAVLGSGICRSCAEVSLLQRPNKRIKQQMVFLMLPKIEEFFVSGPTVGYSKVADG